MKKALTNKVGKVRELKIRDIKAMRLAKEVLPKNLLDALLKTRKDI